MSEERLLVLMRARAPVLLHTGFLARARAVLADAETSAETRDRLLARGLFHHTYEQWAGTKEM